MIYQEGHFEGPEIAQQERSSEASNHRGNEEEAAYFCKKYKDWTTEHWSRVMFSDESTFRCIMAMKVKVRWPLGSDRFDSQ